MIPDMHAIIQMKSMILPAEMIDAGFVQRREWMLFKIRDDQYPFNVTAEFEANSFNPLIAAMAIRRMVERYEILRTTLTVHNGGLKQVIHDPERFSVEPLYYNLTDMGALQRDEFRETTSGKLVSLPFDFETGPLFRIIIFELAPTHFLIILVFHHVISDEHSKGIFKNEIISIYNSLASGTGIELPPVPVQYRQYTHFENELLDTAKGDKYRSWWQTVLVHGLPGFEVADIARRDEFTANYLERANDAFRKVRSLPYYDERFMASVIRRYRNDSAGRIYYKYPDAVFQKIKDYAEAGINGTLSLFLAGLVNAFHRLSGQRKFVFDIPASRGANREHDKTMGWLTSGGPCFLEMDEKIGPAKFLSYIDRQLYQLSKYCVFPFEAAGYAAGLPTGCRMPAFLTLSHQQYHDATAGHGLISHEPAGYTAYQDIAFFVSVTYNSASMEIVYNNALFTGSLVERIVEEQATMLESVLDSYAALQRT